MYVTTNEMLRQASDAGYAVGAFNAENAEMVWAIIEGARQAKAPVIIQTTPGTLRYLGPEYFVGMVKNAAEKADVPVALHLDHGSSYELATACMDIGYSSVMIDGSALSFEENAALTARVCKSAIEKGVPVEGELGVIGGKEDDTHAEESLYADPVQALDFIAQTGVSSLALAVGTAHGFYKAKPKLNLELISQVKAGTDTPLVLHGASGLEDEAVQSTVRLGMAKVNFATELRGAYTQAVRQYLDENPAAYDPKSYGTVAREAVVQLVRHKIAVCGSEGKA